MDVVLWWGIKFHRVWIGEVLVWEIGQYYPISSNMTFYSTNNMAKHKAYILGLRMAIEMNIKEILALNDSDLLVH